MMTTETTAGHVEIDGEPTITVQGRTYTVAEARRDSDTLRMAADRIELASEDAVNVLRACADVAGLVLLDLAREAGVEKADPETWTIYDARRVAVQLGSRIKR